MRLMWRKSEQKTLDDGRDLCHMTYVRRMRVCIRADA